MPQTAESADRAQTPCTEVVNRAQDHQVRRHAEHQQAHHHRAEHRAAHHRRAEHQAAAPERPELPGRW